MIKAGLILFALAIGLPVLCWLWCLTYSSLDGQRFYVTAYRMSVVMPASGLLVLAGVVVFVVDYVMRIKGLK